MCLSKVRVYVCAGKARLQEQQGIIIRYSSTNKMNPHAFAAKREQHIHLKKKKKTTRVCVYVCNFFIL